MPETSQSMNEEPLELLIFSIRSYRVILDADLARLYGVSTKALNQAMKRGRTRFSAGLRLSTEQKRSRNFGVANYAVK